MLGKWCAAGQSADTFGLQTPRTIQSVLDANWKKQEAENERCLTQAWLTARLSLSDPKKFPSLDKITGRKQAPRKMTPEEMLRNVRFLKAAFQGDNDDG